MIYLDNAATTKVFDCAINAADSAMRESYFNPNATYRDAVAVKASIEKSRRTLAGLTGINPDEIVFTSCATESNNWVFNRAIKNPKGNIVISAGEHSSVYEPAMSLKSKGTDVRIAPLRCDGSVDTDKLYELVDQDTTLVSVIHVSNETGAVNPIKQISSKVKSIAPRAIVHSDGVQGFLKAEPIGSLGVDLYSASAHKIGAPKGIGLLYIRRGVTLAPNNLGGGQERGLRSGTQNTPGIAAFAAAAEHFSLIANHGEVHAVREKLCDYFKSCGFRVIGGAGSGYILCVSIPRVRAEILQNLVCEKGVIIGKGAACSGSKRGNRVLEALGLSREAAECCIRISFFADVKRNEALDAAHIITETAERIRRENVI